MTVKSLAHTAVCVPDVDEAVDWYRDVLGMKVLSHPYEMSGEDIERDMGELVPGVRLKAAIVGFDRSDHVLELIEYVGAPAGAGVRKMTDVGISHVGLVCDDLDATRAELEERGAWFVTSSIASVAGLRTTWLADPYGTVLILVEKRVDDRPYWRQPVRSEASPPGG